MIDQHRVDPSHGDTVTTSLAHDVFAPEQRVEARSVEEALQACESSFRYDRAEIAIDQIILDNSLTLSFHGKWYLLTWKAFEDVCKLVKLPMPFARGIPLDLIATIVDRLKVLHQQTALVIRRDNVIVGIVDPLKWAHSRAKQRRTRYEPVPVSKLLQLIQEVWISPENLLHISIADSGVRVKLLSEASTIEPQVGDVTAIGMVVTGSETGGAMPQARGYTLRLSCTNGATVPTTFGQVRFSTDWRVNFDLRLQVFQAKLREFAIDLTLLGKTYERLVSEHLTDHLFANFHRQARYIYRHSSRADEFADRALGVEREQRRRIVAQCRQRQAELRGVSTHRHALPKTTSILAWDVFNSITAAARRETLLPRSAALEGLAGDVLNAYSSKLP